MGGDGKAWGGHRGGLVTLAMGGTAEVHGAGDLAAGMGWMVVGVGFGRLGRRWWQG